MGRYKINNINSNKKESYIYAPIELFLEASKYQYDYKLARKRITYGNVSANTLRKILLYKSNRVRNSRGSNGLHTITINKISKSTVLSRQSKNSRTNII